MPQLPFGATRVIKACHGLTLAEKLVWLEDYALDGLEGAWITHENLGARLGMEGEVVRTMRKRLQEVGLHESVPRPGAKSRGWHALLPPEFLPIKRPAPEEIARLAAALDAFIARAKYVRQDGRQVGMDIPSCRVRKGAAPGYGDTQMPTADRDRRTQVNGHAHTQITGYGDTHHIEDEVGEEAGGEAGATPSSGSRTENPPSLLSPRGEAGAFAHANERSGSKGPTRIGDTPLLQSLLRSIS